MAAISRAFASGENVVVGIASRCSKPSKLPKINVPIFLDRAAQRAAEIVSLRRPNRSFEKVSRQRRYSSRTRKGAMKLIGPRLGNDADLRTGFLSIFGAVIVAHDVVFSDRIDAQHEVRWRRPASRTGCPLRDSLRR